MDLVIGGFDCEVKLVEDELPSLYLLRNWLVLYLCCSVGGAGLGGATELPVGNPSCLFWFCAGGVGML